MTTARTGGLTQRFTLAFSALAVVGDVSGAMTDEKALTEKLLSSRELGTRMVSIVVESDEDGLRLFCSNLDARSIVDSLAAVVARIAQQVDEEMHRRS